MTNKEKQEMLEFRAQVLKGFELALEKLIVFKKKNNSPFVVLRDGKITQVPATEIEKGK